MACKMRLYNPQWTNLTFNDLRRKDVHGKYPMMFHISYQGAANTNATEIGAAANAAKDGTTTRFQLFVVSSNVSDIDEGDKDVRAIAIIGISAPTKDGVAVYSVEEIRMNGTTNVTNTRWYERVIHMYAVEWGSNGADALGNITAEAPENTALLTIAIAANESNSSKIWVADGFYGRWKMLDARMYDVAFNNT